MKEFENKVALIIGGTSGIGNATANALLESGATVHIVGRNTGKVADAPNLIKHSVNISNMDEVQSLISTIESLSNLDFESAKRVSTFGMNAAYRHWHEIKWYPTYYSCLDSVVGSSHKDGIFELIHNSGVYGIKSFLLSIC